MYTRLRPPSAALLGALPHPIGDPAMVTRGRREELIPSAARLIESLRGLGYKFTTAVADLVDNSISAGAGQVDITVNPDGADSWVRIADDGRGMDAAAISEAMRLGSGGRDYATDDLGKFGLGLKTASMSQARSITVASRSNKERRVIDCRVLDLDDVVASNKWEIVHPIAAERPEQVVEPLQDGTGTVVLWRKLDRVLKMNDPTGGWAFRRLMNLTEELEAHLAMVFGKFLSGTARRRKGLTITINGMKVLPWDPFCLDQDTARLPEHQIEVAGGVVTYRPYVLPPQSDFTNDDEWRRASGPMKWNDAQGLYFYRADRLIQSGGWSWLRGKDEHVKLARASLEFWPTLDDTFEIDISKMRVKLPPELRDRLTPLVGQLTSAANERYRKASRNSRKLPPPPPRRQSHSPLSTERALDEEPRRPAATPVSAQPSERLLDEVDSGPRTSALASVRKAEANESSSDLTPDDRRSALERAAARAGAVEGLDRIGQELHRLDPEVARDLGW